MEELLNENTLSENTESDIESPVSVSGNEIALENILQPSVSGGDILMVQCECHRDTPLWESDIADYTVTEGLLLLILIVLCFGLICRK